MGRGQMDKLLSYYYYYYFFVTGGSIIILLKFPLYNSSFYFQCVEFCFSLLFSRNSEIKILSDEKTAFNKAHG